MCAKALACPSNPFWPREGRMRNETITLTFFMKGGPEGMIPPGGEVPEGDAASGSPSSGGIRR